MSECGYIAGGYDKNKCYPVKLHQKVFHTALSLIKSKKLIFALKKCYIDISTPKNVLLIYFLRLVRLREFCATDTEMLLTFLQSIEKNHSFTQVKSLYLL